MSGEQGFYAEIDVAPGWRDYGFTHRVLEGFVESYKDLVAKTELPIGGYLTVFVYDEGVDIVDTLKIPLPVGREEEMLKLFERFAEAVVGMVKLLVGENENES